MLSRPSCNAAEARLMLAASQRGPNLVAQVVPSPYGLKGDAVMRELIDSGWLGEWREVELYSPTGALADPATPLPWRQDALLSGVNRLTLGILQRDADALGPTAGAGAGPGPRLYPDADRPRQRRPPDFATGVAYMEFTEAAAVSAREGTAVELPLANTASG